MCNFPNSRTKKRAKSREKFNKMLKAKFPEFFEWIKLNEAFFHYLQSNMHSKCCSKHSSNQFIFDSIYLKRYLKKSTWMISYNHWNNTSRCIKMEKKLWRKRDSHQIVIIKIKVFCHLYLIVNSTYVRYYITWIINNVLCLENPLFNLSRVVSYNYSTIQTERKTSLDGF